MRADARSNRQDLVEAAWKLLAAEGPDASLRAIAQEAGVGIATLYRHYPTRDDLILGVVDEVQARVREILAGARERTWVVVNATEYTDLEVVAEAMAGLE